MVRLAALLALFAFIPLSSQSASAFSNIESGRNTSSTLAQVGPRATFIVTSLNDSGPGTLREAIVLANSAAGADTITFAVTGLITLASNLPNISDDLTIIGPGVSSITITGSTTVTPFRIADPIDLNISGLTLTGMNIGVNVTSNAQLTLTDMAFSSMAVRAVHMTAGSHNLTRIRVTANVGMRAVYASNATVTMTDSTISGSLQNAMEISGGTVTITGSTFANNIGATAGAIYVRETVAATVNITASTFANNTGDGAGAIYAASNVGPTTVNITNSTFSANISTNTNNADAIYAHQNATVDISFSTFSGHSNSTATSNTGIIHAGTNADIVLWASIIANNPAGGTPRECTAGSGATFSASDNLTNDTVCTGRIGAPTNVSATLADNGGPTQTHALLAGSNAIDAYTGVSCPATDQRGLPRPAADTDCDLGAYEIPFCPTSPATIPAGNVAALIFAIECANAGPSDNVINLTNSTYLLTVTHNTFFGSENGLPQIASTATAGTLAINGNGATISGNDERRVLYVNGGANVTLDDLTITAGHVPIDATGGGGIMNYGTLTLNGGGVSASSAGRGGGIMNNYGTLTLNGSVFADNEALVHGGGVFNNGDMTVTGSTFSGNTAESNGGAIQGEGALTVTDSIFSGNTATTGHGGAIYSVELLNISGSRFTGNTATYGGGVSMMGSASTAEITDALFNTNTSSFGGAIHASMSGANTLLLMNSTLSGNSALTNGGGILSIGTTTVTNTTIANNSANRSGGISSSGTMTVNNSTIVANAATTDRDGVYVNSGTMTLNNTILANGDEDCILNAGTVDANYSLFSNANACGAVNGVDGNIVGVDPMLGTLATAPNGTSYYPLLAGSPAINSGSNALVPVGLDFDQAGNVRLQGGTVDMGAFETDTPAPVCPTSPATIPAGDVAALIFAIECANAGPSDNVINLTNSTYLLTVTHNTLTGDNGLPLIASAATAGTLTINGNGATISGNDERRVLFVDIDANLTLNDMLVTDGHLTSFGGSGIINKGTLTLNGSTISGNTTGFAGAGIMNSGTLTLTNSTVSSNTAATGGGGITNHGVMTLAGSTVSGNTAGNSGGIENHGTLTLVGSTISGNTAINGSGGGIRNSNTLTLTGSTVSGNTATVSGGGGIFSSGTLTLTGSTVSGNTANSDGGGIYNMNTLTLNNATISGNTAISDGDGIYNFNVTNLSLNNSILANSDEDCILNTGTVDANYTLFSNANACGAVNGVDGNRVGVDPMLGALATAPNGTSYYPLNFASPAIDAGSDALIPVGVTTDQAGNNRIRQARVDMGAFESDFEACPSFPATISAGDVAALIFAIECANALPSNDVINLTNSTYTLTATHNTASGANGLPQIVSAATAGTLTINGNGATISGNNQRRVIYSLAGADLTLNTLTVSGGSTSISGGGIYNSGALTLNDSTVSGNTADYDGGGIQNYNTLTLNNTTISGNIANSGSGGGISHSNNGTLTLTDSIVSGNIANNGAGGGIRSIGTLTLTGSTVFGNTAGGAGGGISGSGTLTLTNSTVSTNSAPYGGGIINIATLTLNNVTVSGNTASASGDGIYNQNILTLNNTILANSGEDCFSVFGTVDANYTLFSNTNACGAVNGVDGNIVGVDPLLGALTGSPAYYPLNFASPAIDAGSDALIPSGITTDQAGNNRIRQARVDMGAFESDFKACPAFPATIPAGDVAALILAIECANISPSDDVINLANSTYTLTATHNMASGANGLPQIASATTAGTLTINGNGATISGNNQRRVIYSLAGADLTLNTLTVSGGSTSISGGGIYNSGTLALTGTTVSGSTAPYGGGIMNYGTLTLTGSTVSGNTANGSGGGGGIYSSGTLTLTGSTVSGNTTTYFNNSNGGGIVASGTVTLTDSTVSGNTANGSGGGIFGNTTLMTLNNSTVSGNTSNDSGGGFFSYGTVILNNSTVTGNTAVSSGGGFYNAGTLTLNNTILAINTPFDCVASINSISITMQHSLIMQQHSCGIVNGVDGNIVGADPLLGTLTTAPNGTSYHPLLAGSPAINSGSNALVLVGLDFDQAGNARIQGGTVDMGAFETDTPAAPEINVTGNSVDIADGDATPDLADHTDFGTTTVGTPVTRAFTIENTGNAALTITSIMLPSGFVEAAPSHALSVAAGSSTTLNMECEALSFGVYTGDIVINSDDADENPYTFTFTCQVDHAVPAGITVTQSSGSTTVAEAGATDTYTVALDRVPSADVTVTLSFNGQITANGSASPVVLTFTPANWATAQDVTVAAVNDSLVEGAHSAVISQSVSSTDADYNAISLADISVTISDNDTAQVIFPASAANISEDITPYSQNAVLSIASDPVGGSLATAVTVQLTQTAGTALTAGDYTLTTASLTFPAGSVSGTTQLFSVDIVNDALEEANETFVVGFGAITGPATATGTHTVTILANDAPVCPTSPATIPAGDVDALIFAIECANASPSDDVINLTNSTYTLAANHNTSNGPNGLPFILSTATAGRLTINGGGATISGNGERRVLHAGSGATITVNNLIITEGSANLGFGGGGILNINSTLTLNNVVVTQNATSNVDGGGIYNDGTLTLIDSTVSGNTVTGSGYAGGGVFNYSGDVNLTGSTVTGNSADNAGGIWTDASSTLTLIESTISNNTAAGEGAGGIGIHFATSVVLLDSTISGNNASVGGGIYNSSGALTMTNSTIVANNATDSGGGIINTGDLTINNSTIAANTATSLGDGLYIADGILTLNNSVLANAGADCVADVTVSLPETQHTLFSNGNSCGAVNGVDGNLVGADPLLGTLTVAPNGTSYYPLNFTSPAIDAGSDALIPVGITTDQAGNVRIRQARVDMGAFESNFVGCPAFPATIPAGDVAALILAIECANALPSNDVIELTGSSTYLLTANHNTTNGPNGLPQIASAAAAGTLTINGNGATIDGNDQRRVLSILSGANVTLNNVSLANGLAGNGAGIRNYGTTTLNRSTIRDNTGTSDGGGFFNWGTLTIVNSTITGNTSGGWGGGIANGNGTLTLKNTTIAGNTAVSGGGLSASGTVTVHNSILSANTATASPNLDCAGTVTASHSLFRTGSCGILHGASGNRVGSTQTATLGLTLVTPVDGSPAYYTINPSGVAVNTGDNALVPVGVTTDQPGNPRIQAITVDMGSYEVYAPACPVSGDTIPASDVGMLIYAIECANASPTDETFELTDSTYTLTEPYNFSLNGLPQISATTTSGTLTINGNGATISGSDTVRIFEVSSDGDLTLNDVTLTNGRVTGINSGGAISVPASSARLTLNDVTITNSVAENRGGAIYNFGEITISSSTLSGNSATDGGAIYNARTANITGSTISGNTATTGGGFYTTGASLNLTGSTVADNVSTGSGGGFYIGAGAVEMRESTVSGNTTQSSGAGFYVNSNAGVGLYNSTVTDNTADLNGGAAYMEATSSIVWMVNTTVTLNAAADGAGIFMNNGSLTVRNSILAGNTSDTGVNPDCYRVTGNVSSTHNLYQNGSCGATNGVSGDIVGADPLLGTLTTAPNGTEYHPLLVGSVAINTGDNAMVTVSMLTDQAGNTRIQGGTVDMGAFETDTPAFVPEINVTGSGVDIASGDATPDLADHTDFGTMLVGAPVTRAFTIHNTGTGTATLTINSFTLPSGFVEAAPAPSMEIPAGGSTTLNVECEATWADTYSGTVTINTNDADESAYTFAITCLVDPLVPEINVTGSGVDIASGDTTPSLVDHTDFGTTPAGTPLTRTFTIENSGTGDLNLSGVMLPSGFSIVSPLPDPVIAAGGSAALNAQCDAAASGIYFGTVEIYNDDADESVYEFDVACMVNGPEIEVYGNAVLIVDGDTTPDAGDDTDFGTTSTGMPVGALFSILNMGNEALTIDAVAVPSGFTVIAQPAESVPAGTSTALEIRCTAAVDGIYSGAVTLSTNDFDENPYTFDIACGVNAPDIDITGNGITIASGDMTPDLADHTDFGMTMVGVPVTRTFTIENHGDGTLTLFTVESTLTGFVGTGGLPAFIIPPGGSTTVSLECSASAAGTYGGTFGFTSNDPDESPYIFAITCSVEALSPDISITGNGVVIANGDISPSLTDHSDFGSTTVGTPVTRTFTIHNNGDAVLLITDGSLPTGFAPAMPMPETTIAAGSSTSFGVQCPAAAVGVISGTLVIESNDPDSPSYSFGITCEVDPAPPPDINITGNGVTIANGDVTPDLSDHTDFGVTTVGVPVVRTFTIENTGSGVLNLTGIVGSLTGFTGAGDPPALTIPAGGSTTFGLMCEAVAEGTYGGTFGFTSDDPDESPYSFAITCQVDSVPPAGINVIQTDGTTAVTEAGGTDTYTIVLNSQPSADVTVTLTFDSQITVDGQASPVTLTFDAANWNVLQTMTVAAVNDALVEGPHNSLITQTAASADAAYNAIDPADVSVSITDNDTASIAFAAPANANSEAVTTYQDNAVLSIVSDPAGGTLAVPVTVTLIQTPGTAATPDDYTLATTSLTFPAGAGNAATQLYEVSIVNDALDEPDETFTLSFGAVTGPATTSGTHTVTILDDDAAAGVTVTESSGTSVTEAGGTDTYSVMLDSQPTADVTISLTFDSQITANGSASPVALTFDSANWNVLQTVTVAAVNDSSVEGAHNSLIAQTAASADAAYNAVDPADVSVSITDNDTASIAFAAPANANSEAVTTYQDNAVLSIVSDPAGGTLAVPVTVGLLQTPGTAATPDDYTLTTTSLTFPVGSANAATQLYEVSIVNDTLDEPDETFALNFGTVTGPSTASGTHTVTILDDDTVGVTVTESSGTSVTEAGATDTYSVVLDSQPVADVTITLTFDSQITVDGQASPVALTFNAANWNVLQTVTVAAVNDSLVEGAHSSLITQTAASADAAYNAIDPADVSVSITDNDTASIAFETVSGSATEGTSPYTVNAVLSIVSDPVGGTLAAGVQSVITHTAGTAAAPDDYTLTTATVTFPAGAANGAVQPVSVGIVDDALPEGDETFELGFGAASIPASGTHSVTILTSDFGNLLKNPGFEGAGTGITKANKWESSVLTAKDGRVCNTATKTFANSGECAFRFQYSGLLAASRAINQTVVNPPHGIKGERYTFDAVISASNLTPGAKLIVQVKYANGTKAKAVITVPSGSYAYTAVETALPITRKVEWVRVILRGGKASGRLLIDDLVLWVEPGTPATTRGADALLPLPAAPDGFRSSGSMP